MGHRRLQGAWIDEATAARFDGLKQLVVQDLFASPLWERAAYQLPGAAFPERDGSYVNFADRLQSARWAIRPPGRVERRARLLADVDMVGLYNARKVLNEVAAAIPYFHVAGSECRRRRGHEDQPDRRQPAATTA